jgi:hydrogenase maturation protease
MKTLILGYGNRSRRDDGVGWFVIEQLAALDLPGVELETGHQLEVEAAETLSHCDAVIFVDAAIPEAPEPIRRAVVAPRFQGHAVAHYLTPADVLSLCKTLYGHEPRATLFSIRGCDFNFGTALSPEVELAAREVVRQIVEMVRSSEFHSQPAADAVAAQN